ncbi:hypothetical protein [Leuconostoc citreum]|uniref:hypothetical protein n=1 Tax=Leuconostoc citreum TaxID=33964 RepID=UPI0032E04545
MGKSSDNNTKARNFLKQHAAFNLKPISKIDIIALVGLQNTGKTVTLNELIAELIQNNAFNLVEEFIGLDLNIINQKLNILNDDHTIYGDTRNGQDNDRVAIFNNATNGKRIGIVTTGDTPSIVAVGLLYLSSRQVDIAIIASHLVTFNQLISEINPLSAQIDTHKIDVVNDRLLMRNKNIRLLTSYLN